MIAFILKRLGEPGHDAADAAAKRMIVTEYQKRAMEYSRLRGRGEVSTRLAGILTGLEYALIHIAGIDREHPDYDPLWES
jgi:hypothetical protein